MESNGTQPRRFAPLHGLRSTGTGVIGAGVCTYLFLALAGRVLGPVGFAPVSALWAMVFIVGPGLFLPVQQELGRLVARHRSERAGSHALAQVASIAAGLALVTILATVAAGDWIVHHLLDGNVGLLVCFEVSVLAYVVSFVARGVLSGLGEFPAFGLLVFGEAAARLVIGGALTLAGARTALSFGVAIAVAPALSAALVTRLGSRTRLSPGPARRWRSTIKAMAWLVVASLAAQVVANAGPLVVQVLAGQDRSGEAGRFLSALVIARLALYLFQAVQATMLPNFAVLVAQHRAEEFTRAVRRLTALCLALVVLSTLGGFALGPAVVDLMFGEGFAIPRATMALLAGASGLYVLAAGLTGVAIASARHRRSALAWVTGTVFFALGLLTHDDLFLRVAIGYLLGSAAAAGVLLTGVTSLPTEDRSGPVPD